jgi:hypothetical protein
MVNTLFSKINLLVLAFCLSFPIYSQKTFEESKAYYWFDNIIGQNNSGLYKGIEYREEYRFFSDAYHKFYLENKFYLGNILYDGELYSGVEMKYDLYEDNIIIKVIGESKYLFISLIPELIEEFSIKKHKFIRITNNTAGLENGFFELIYKSKETTCLKKIVKKAYKVYEESALSYKFLSKNYYTVLKNENNFEISSKSSIIKIFPTKKKLINSFFKNNKNLYKNYRDVFLKQLLEKLEND